MELAKQGALDFEPNPAAMKSFPASGTAVLLASILAHVLDWCRIARGPFVLQHLEIASCDYRCQCGITAACALYHFLGKLACRDLSAASIHLTGAKTFISVIALFQ